MSPATGSATSNSPWYAVSPGIPRIPTEVEIGAASGSILRTSRASITPYSCQPILPMAKSPTANRSELEATTSPTASPSITPPIGTAAA